MIVIKNSPDDIIIKYQTDKNIKQVEVVTIIFELADILRSGTAGMYVGASIF